MLARHLSAAALVAAVLAIRSLPGPGDRDASTPPRPRPDLVVYLVDTLRRDHLGVYGYPRNTSPRLDSFARDAVVFENAFAPSSWTRPSTASLLTGLSPRHHGARTRLGSLSEEAFLLSEAVDAAGYTTLAFVANPNVVPLWGFGQGFDEFEDVGALDDATGADAMVDRVLRRLDRLAPDEPVFLYVHTVDPHMPYAPPPPFDDRFTGGPETTRHYDGEIAFGDHHFGRLIDHLRERRRYDDAIVVFVSDHGEALGEHGGGGHGHSLFDEVVRIPLLVKLPGSQRAGERVERAVALVDAMPSLLPILGIPVPEGLDGTDALTPRDGRTAEHTARPLFFDLELEWTEGRLARARAVRAGNWKLVEQHRPQPFVALFDLASDPAETVDRRHDSAEKTATLRALLDTHVASHAEGFHLRALHGKDRPPLRCRAELETTGRFVALARRMLEADDRVTLAADGTAMRIEFSLRNAPHPQGEIPRVVIDEDAISFDVDPPDAGVHLHTLPTSAQDPCVVWLGAAEAPLRGTSLRFGDPAMPLAISDPAQLSPRGGAIHHGFHVGVLRADRAVADVPPGIAARLRALGYLD